MSRLFAITVVSGLVLFASAGEAAAQGTAARRPNFGPYWRPQLTPYLNLARGGNPAVNYFLGTLPEQDRRYNYDFLRGSLQELDSRTLAIAREERLVEPVTAPARVTYGNLGPYYGNTAGYYGEGGVRFGVVPQPRIGEPVTRPRR
jgi:hypothetical protein